MKSPAARIVLVLYMAVLLLCCAQSSNKVTAQDSGLVGIWALTTLNNKNVTQTEQTIAGRSYKGSREDLVFEITKGQLVVSSWTGMAVIKDIRRVDKTLVLIAEQNGTGEYVGRNTIVLHFISPDRMYITSGSEPNFAEFYWTGAGTIYSRVPLNQEGQVSPP